MPLERGYGLVTGPNRHLAGRRRPTRNWQQRSRDIAVAGTHILRAAYRSRAMSERAEVFVVLSAKRGSDGAHGCVRLNRLKNGQADNLITGQKTDGWSKLLALTGTRGSSAIRESLASPVDHSLEPNLALRFTDDRIVP